VCRTRIIQGVAGTALSVLGLMGLAGVASAPAVAQEPEATDVTSGMQPQMQDMVAQCSRMTEMMSNMDDRGMSNMMRSGGMSGMTSDNR
jgi:hypothetical protein